MRNLESGYTVFDVATEHSTVMTCTGCIIPPRCSVKVEVEGTLKADRKYGTQLVNCVLREIIMDNQDVIDYLTAIPGVGDATAIAVRDSFGPAIMDILQRAEPVEDLVREARIPHPKAEAIVEYIKKNAVRSELFGVIAKFGGEYITAEKIYSTYGIHSMEALLASPYLVGLAAGLPFKVCDAISISNGGNPMSADRIQAALETVLTVESSMGHTYLPRDEAIQKVRYLLSQADKQVALSSLLMSTVLARGGERLQYENNRVYLRYLYWQEVKTAYALARLCRTGIRTECDPNELCTYAEGVCGVTYATRQREIFKALQCGGVCVLTGGPGTGKTTVIKGFLAAYEKLFPGNTIKLCAPTGRAAQRMSEATGRPATTIHRLLEYRPYGDSMMCKNEADPINAHCIVVDESSMIAIDTAELLFSAIRSGTMVLLVGDINQLPSVGAGNVLADIIASKTVPVVALNKTQRQGAGSPIIENAKRICAGDPSLMETEDFTFISKVDDAIPDTVVELYARYHDPDDPFKVQVLVPSRKNKVTGSEALSRAIQKRVNTQRPALWYGQTGYAIGDKVMTTQNNYNVGYMNGDVGLITRIDEESITVRFNDETLDIPASCLSDVSLAYASTVHKSQGSEYETAIVALPSEPANMLQRNILYTAVTRAKKRVIVVASDGSVTICINTERTTKRRTSLAEMLVNRIRKEIIT